MYMHFNDGPFSLLGAQALSLPQRHGELRVLEGSVWLTRHGDGADHRLHAGQSLWLRADDLAVVQPWSDDERVRLTWRPQAAAPRYAAAGLAFALRGLARLAGAAAGRLRAAEDGLAARARSAASSARRAQGCMSCGDSMASSGGA